MKPLITFITILVIAGGALFLLRQMNIDTPTTQSLPSTQEPIKVIATGLEVPWALAFLPNGDLLITERRGVVRLRKKDGTISEIGKINGVKQIVEGGLHGVAVDPDYSNNKYIYLYYTYGETLGNTQNKVVRFKFDGQAITDEFTIIDNIPGAPIHDGGRLKFGPDGYLYITTGDAANPSLSQDKNSLAGKVLRYQNGKVEVYSYGHRNPQGITWDSERKLWEVEHGQSATDEINLIEQGKNYGWPVVRGDETQEGLVSPILNSGSDTWAPAGMAFYDGSLYFGGLRGQALFQYDIKNKQSFSTNKELKTHFKGKYGRIRDVVLGPDGFLYITTSNKDGRGSPRQGDDKIIRINPEILNSF